MAATTTNILLFGATGLIGQRIANAIVSRKEKFGKIVVFTSPNTISTKSDEIAILKAHGVEVISGDVTSFDDVNQAYNGIDTVVSAVGRPVIQNQLKLIEWADKHPDVKRFFPSEYGTDIEYWPSSANEKPHQQKLKVRALLNTVGNLEYTYVVTGPYSDLFFGAQKPENEKDGTFDVQRKRAVLLGTGDDKISFASMRDVGKFVLAALLHPEQVKNRALHLNSFTTTPHHILAEFERQTGGQKWSVDYVSLDELKKLEEDAWNKGSPRSGALTLRRIWTSGGTLYDKRDNHLIDLEDNVDDLESAVRLAVEAQKK